MKSERAKKFIDDDAVILNNGDRMVDASTAYTAIDIAEHEAEERIRKRAHHIIREMMAGIFHGCMPRKIADEFSHKLTEE